MISEYFRDDGATAQVYKVRGKESFFIIYTDQDGQIMNVENFYGKALGYVEDAAENFALGIKKERGNDLDCGMSRK